MKKKATYIMLSLAVSAGAMFGGGNQAEASSPSAIISDAKNYIGVPYVYGGISPSGFDCSGFLNYVFEKNGVDLPRTTADIYRVGTSVSKGSLELGDLVFFETYKPGASHAGIYVGSDQFIHASSSKGITISSLSLSYWDTRYLGAKRVLDSNKALELVNQAVSLSNDLRPYYSWNVSDQSDLVVSDAFMSKYNETGSAIKNAEAELGSSNADLQDDLQYAKDMKLNAARFIDGVKVGKDLDQAKTTLKSYIDSQILNDQVVEAYHKLSYEIRRSERAMSRVYGSKYRDLFMERYVTSAKITKETIIYEVSRYELMEEIEVHLQKGETQIAQDKIAMLERLEKRSIEIKKAGNELHPGKYPTLNDIEYSLNKMKDEIL
ncbi:NlpC/P60 family protein [Pseudalkalibacillus sp. R45]|uniref:NlpC/P60 family protein n=1 Tax=Pseudalkalibacillus sp. R45 TaxID=3457433 RepID=UPI003FCE452B